MVRKCSETVVGLEILDVLSTGLRCSLKRPLSPRLVSPICIVWSSGCNVNVISDRSGFACSVECL